MLGGRVGRAWPAALVIAALAAGAVGCGSDDEQPAAADRTATSAADDTGGPPSADTAERAAAVKRSKDGDGSGRRTPSKAGGGSGESRAAAKPSPSETVLGMYRAYIRGDQAGVCARQEGSIAECRQRDTSFVELARKNGAYDVLRGAKVLHEAIVGPRGARVTVRVGDRTTVVRLVRARAGEWRVGRAQSGGEDVVPGGPGGAMQSP